jgi:hypothetical protein
LTNVRRIDSKVAPRHRERFGAACRSECSNPRRRRRNSRNWFACQREHAVLSERVALRCPDHFALPRAQNTFS